MNISEICKSFYSDSFEYQNKRYMFSKLTSYDTEISVNIIPPVFSNLDYIQVKYTFNVNFGNDVLTIGSVYPIFKYIPGEYENRKFLGLIPYKGKKHNPIFHQLNVHWMTTQLDFKEARINNTTSATTFAEYISDYTKDQGHYNYVRIWSNKIIEQYQNYLENH